MIERKREIIKAKKERIFPLPLKVKPVATKHRYRMVFNSDFNLGFGLPCSDTCANCGKLNIVIKSDPNDMGVRQQLADHQDMADRGYETMQGNREAASASWSSKSRPLGLAGFSSVDAVDIISFDFQQNLPIPNLQHKNVFYGRQLT